MSQLTESNRLEWVDAAKGLAIVLVVLHHSVLLLGQEGLLGGPWVEINKSLEVFRMPLFFAAAGLFASNALTRSWSLLWDRRLSLYIWVFSVWTVIRFLYFSWFPMEARPYETDVLLLLRAPLLPSTGLWFLHALFFFFVVAKFLNTRVDYRVQLITACAVSVFALSFVGGNISWGGMGKYFFFFLAGCYFRNVLVRWVEAAGWTSFLLVGLVFVAGVFVIEAFSLQLFGPIAFVVRTVAVVFGFLLAGRLVRSVIGRILTALGKRTLEIYVVHVLVIAALVSMIAAYGPLPEGIDLVKPVILTPTAIAISLGIHAALIRVPGLKYLYKAPRWLYMPRRITHIG